MKAASIAALVCATVVAVTGDARADDPITVGIYAPTAPFGSTSDRLGFVTDLASHLESSAGGREVVGRVYARAGQLTAAVKSGEVQFAVVDASYAAARGLPYKILGAAVRNGSSTAIWQLVGTSDIKGLADLAKKTIAAPRVGSRDTAFVTNVLLGGEVDSGYFDSITFAPNPNSAATMVSLDRAAAALVPVGTKLPSGVRPILNVATVGEPMFVAMPGADKTLVAAFGTAIFSFGGSTFSSFAAPSKGDYTTLKGRFGRAAKRPIMTEPDPTRLATRKLLAGRTFTIAGTDLSGLIAAPEKKAK